MEILPAQPRSIFHPTQPFTQREIIIYV